MSSDEMRGRLDELERRVAVLEAGSHASPQSEDFRPEGPHPESYQPTVPTGVLSYHGELSEPLELSWTIQVEPNHALDLDDGPRTAVLAALGHPVRAALVRTLARHGSQTTAALQHELGIGSTGQLYHHLKNLTACGLVEQDKRGGYRLRPQATIPALVLLTAAADIAGQLRG